MTRARAGDYDVKRRAILDSAAALFATRGYEKTTMNTVAADCGASKSHLYHYFTSKEDLLFGIVHEHIEEQSAELNAIVAEARPAEERFTRFVDSFVHRAAHSRNEHLALMNDLKHLPDRQRKQVHDMMVALTHLMVRLLKEINPRLMEPAKVQAPYALLLFGMIIWTFSWYEKDGKISPSELAARISDLFVNGFRGAH
jgi:AcrR family transcriptional regulator